MWLAKPQETGSSGLKLGGDARNPRKGYCVRTQQPSHWAANPVIGETKSLGRVPW